MTGQLVWIWSWLHRESKLAQTAYLDPRDKRPTWMPTGFGHLPGRNEILPKKRHAIHVALLMGLERVRSHS